MQFLLAVLIGTSFVSAPTTLVDTFVGTSGTPAGGPIDTFPGADVPFGMIQWSPDTPSQNAGGGYEYGDKQITGFSLTHLSGPGCSVFGDFAILPTTGAVPQYPPAAKEPFSHATEESAPGWYAVSLGEPAVRAELTVTKRTGIGRFTFPATAQANLLVNAGSNQAGVAASSIRVDSPTEISGSASSGFFCGMPDRYTVYFVARFDRAFTDRGAWQDGPANGLRLTFDATRQRQLLMKVALSFVSVAGARANLAAEDPGWNILTVRDRATDAWSGVLRRVQVAGGTPAEERTFYTALYHTLLHPNVIDDVTGLYMGFDNRVHRVARGHDEYANFSDWDIYRTEIPLIGLLAPDETSDMVRSLVHAFRQEGWLPRWPLVNGTTSVMGGDSVDPVIAGAYAFGARDFDARAALAAMVKGATSTQPPPAQGWYYQRWELHDAYLQRGYIVNTHTTSVSPVPNGASETLEYALDDFAIARLAAAVHETNVYDAFLRRSSNWATLFDTATGWIAPRDPAGAFMATPLTENGQSGFQEGNAAQYTWMVPQDLRDLIAGMGGPRAAAAKLDTFFSQLDADQTKPYAWLGNEPSLGSPWVYLSAGEPWRAEAVLRQALTTLYADRPDGLPGNDDLGTMSAWYVWCALGLYPQEPAARYLDVGAPLFAAARIVSPDGTTIEVRAPQSSDANLYVQGLSVDGRASARSWVALPYRGALRLDLAVGPSPNPRWASAPGDAPLSYAASRVTFPNATTAAFEPSSAIVRLQAGASASLPFAIAGGDLGTTVSWRAAVPVGLHLSEMRASVIVAAHERAEIAPQVSASAGLTAGYYTVRVDGTAQNGAALEHLALRVRVSNGNAEPTLAYALNRFGNSVTPLDARTLATLPEIAVGEEPRGAVFSADGARIFVSDSGENAVSVVDLAQRRAVAKIAVGSTPMGIAIAPDGRTVWVANDGDGTVEPIDAVSLRPGAAIRVGASPRDVAITPDGATLYVSDNWSNGVTPIDLRTRTAGTPIAVGLRPAGLAVTPDGKRLYVVDSASNDVLPIDLSGSGRTFAPIRVGVAPLEIAISSDGRFALVSNHAGSTVTPIDLTTGKALEPIEAGGAPYGVRFLPGGHTAYVTLSRDNACVIVNLDSGKAGAPVPLGNGPSAIVIR